MSTITKARRGKPAPLPVQLLSTQQAADKLKVKPVTIRKYIRLGTLKAYRLGTDWFVDPVDLKAFVPRRPGAPDGNRNNPYGNPGPRKKSRKAS